MGKVTKVDTGVTNLKEYRCVLNEVESIRKKLRRMNVANLFMAIDGLNLNVCSNRNTLIIVDIKSLAFFAKPLGPKLMKAILYGHNKFTAASIVDRLDPEQTVTSIARAFNAEKETYNTRLHVMTELINMNCRTASKKRPQMVVTTDIPEDGHPHLESKMVARNMATGVPVISIKPKAMQKIKLSAHIKKVA